MSYRVLVLSDGSIAHDVPVDIEKPRRRADVKVLFQNAARVLNRHLVSRERHHTAAEIEMEPVERRAFEWHGRNHVAHDGTRAIRTNTRARNAKGANVATIKGRGSMKTEDMRGTLIRPDGRSMWCPLCDGA